MSASPGEFCVIASEAYKNWVPQVSRTFSSKWRNCPLKKFRLHRGIYGRMELESS